MNKKSLLMISIGTILLFILMPFLKYKKDIGFSSSATADPGFREFISAYTSGYISSRSTIRIVLSTEVTNAGAMNETISKKLFDFSPSIEGETKWIDKRTIEFIPSSPLPAGQDYKADFFLDELMDVSSDYKTFSFNFSIIQQSYEVFFDGITTTDKKTLRWQKLTGYITTADVAEINDMAGVISATQNGKKLKVTWENQPENLIYRFTIDSIKRTDDPQEVKVDWDGTSLKLDKKGSRTFKVPSLNDFVITDVVVIAQPDQYISIRFSDPIQPNQTLEGLVRLTNQQNLKFSVVDNEIRVFPGSRLIGTHTLSVESGIKNIIGKPFNSSLTKQLNFEELKPEIRLLSNGVILPNSSGMVFPFEAVNLHSVDVKIVRIYENNVLQFLQVNKLDGDRELKRVGKTIAKKTIQLTRPNNPDVHRWVRYTLDLSELIKTEPGAIYRINLSFKKKYATYTCQSNDDEETASTTNVIEETENELNENWDNGESYYGYDDYDRDYYYWDGYEYDQRDNPCHISYYTSERFVSHNIISSDIGIISKVSLSGQMQFYTTNLITAEPIGNATVEVYDFQQQLLKTITTNDNGLAELNLNQKPFVVIAKKGDQRGYLKLDDGSSLSVSMFDITGAEIQKGLKGFIYGERGVWRPGDTIFTSFMLEDKQHVLPANHPVVFELQNPMGQIVKRITKTQSVNGVYTFIAHTETESPTGNYTAKIKVGGTSFTKTVKVESIMPNRLKINLDFGKERIASTELQTPGKLSVKWLHGAIAKNLYTKIDASLTPVKTTFKKYGTYTFDDPGKNFYSETKTIYDGTLDMAGEAKIKPDFQTNLNPPGMLQASFTIRSFEPGGAFSIDQTTIPYSPYKSYIGMHMPEGDRFTHMLNTDTTHTVYLVSLDENGNAISAKNLKVYIYKVQWRWWWDNYNDDVTSYIGNNYYQPIQSFETSTTDGKGQFKFRIKNPDWGRFYIRVEDPESKHSCGSIVYMDWPAWAGSSPKGNEGASLLSFTSDKPSYNVGEKATIIIPSPHQGKALISIENGSRVIRTDWVDVSKGETKFTFDVTAEMTPNIYAYVTLIQPHSQTNNDLPIRLYGAIPLMIENPATHLYPELTCADSWQPESIAPVTVSEKNGKEMTYTLAIVDEGLLDLTHFKTPDPWSHFYAREALGVKTWDLYDMVIGAYGGKLERIFTIGGDGGINREGGNKANRFKPMVRFIGPFVLKKGEKKKHEIDIPQYVGAVRVMVVTRDKEAYGSVDKSVKVKRPLMLLATLPRVLGPGESLELPVSIFAMEKHVKNVSVKVECNNLLNIEGETIKNISFPDAPGESMVNFKLTVPSAVGVGKIKVIATCGKERAEQTIEVDVRNPNPYITNVVETMLEAGKTWNGDYKAIGMAGTNKAKLEISSIPPIDLEKRLAYLIQYPHGCIEQTTSSIFPQLFLSDITQLSAEQQAVIQKNITAGINRIKLFQTSSGGFSYWPGDGEPNTWGSNYAGHFLLEAEQKGYTIPYGVIDAWKKYQKQKAQQWGPNSNYGYYNDDLIQAYRLYTLALAKDPELGSMNRLKEKSNLSLQAKWRLAAAYVLAGQADVAKNMINNVPLTVKPYREMDYSYGSNERDEAMILETLILLKDRNKAFTNLKSVSTALSRDQWMSTQTTAYCLIAVSKFVKSSGGSSNSGLQCSYKINGSGAEVNSQLPISQSQLSYKGMVGGNIEVTNKGKSSIFIRVIAQGQPETGQEAEAENGLSVNISYKKMSGNPLDIAKLEQGTDFIQEVTVSNPGYRGEYRQMALTCTYPSGWEIHNARLFGDLNGAGKSSVPTYQDIRDDRVLTYFNIAPGKSKTFRIVLNAAYLGKFYLPAVNCEAMYDNTVNAIKPGHFVEIVRTGESL